jgi:CubicO group peptidase (beta-lactamase class C family)
VFLAAEVALGACLTMTSARAAQAPEAFSISKLAALDAAMTNAIHERKLPGGVVWLERNGQRYYRAYGMRALLPAGEDATEDTIYDAASLTKVVATTPSIMLLVQQGRLRLDDPAAKYIPGFAKRGKGKITIRHLLTHYSGLPADLRLTKKRKASPRSIWTEIYQAKPLAPPGGRFIYSDLGFIVLGKVVEKVSGKSLDVFAKENLFTPLEMTSSGFRPPKQDRERIAPTERTKDGGMMRGEVHDPLASMLGGVAGDAGLFSTAQDLSRFCQMLLNQGSLDGVTVLEPETVRLMVSPQSPAEKENVRAFGWDISSIYSSAKGSHLSSQSYGHTGYTGTSIWIDPAIESYLIILTNRVHPDGRGNVKELRTQIADIVGTALREWNAPDSSKHSR